MIIHKILKIILLIFSILSKKNVLPKKFHKLVQNKTKAPHRKKKTSIFRTRSLDVHLGANIGFEIDGKNIEQLRPIIVIKKLSQNTLLIIPLSSHQKNGTWYSLSFVKEQEGRYCLNQIRMIDCKRLKYRMEKVDLKTFKKLKDDFNNFFNS